MDPAKVSENLQTATSNPDVDRQYMASQDLAEEALKYLVKKTVEEPQEVNMEKILNVYIQQLKSSFKEIHSQAIKCMSNLNPHLNSRHVNFLAPQLLASLLKEVENRDNYLICLQDLIEKIPVTLSDIVKITQTIAQNIQSLLATKSQDQIQRNSLVGDLLRTLSMMLNKWSPVYSQGNIFNAVEFGRLLLNNILEQEDRSVRKQSCVCLGALGHCLSVAQLNDELFNSIKFLKTQGYLPEQEKYAFDFNGSAFQRNIHLSQAINLLTRSVGANFQERNVSRILRNTFQLVGKRDEFDVDLSNQVSEIIELHISSVENLYKHHHIDEDLISVCIELIDYNPNGAATFDDDPIEFEDDYYVDDPTDSSWRARRSGVLLLNTILKHSPNLKETIINAAFRGEQPVLKHLGETNQEMRMAVIQILCNLVQNNQSGNMEVEGLELHLESITAKVSELFEKQDVSQLVKGEVIKLLNLIFANFTVTLQSKPQIFEVAIKTLKQILKGSKQVYNNDQRISALRNLIIFFSSKVRHDHYLSHIKESLAISLQFVNDNYIRVAAESIRLLYTILVYITTVITDSSQFQEGIGEIKLYFLSNLNKDGLDQEIKIEIISGVQKLMESGRQYLSNQDISLILDILKIKIKQDQLLHPILRLLSNTNQVQSENTIDLIISIASILTRTDKQLKLLALKSINNLVAQVPQTLADDLVLKGKQLLNTGDQFMAEEVFLLVNKLVPQSSEIKQIVPEAINHLFQVNHITQDVEQFFRLAGQNKVITSERLVKDISTHKEMRRDNILNVGSALAQVILGESNGHIPIASILQNIDPIYIASLRVLLLHVSINQKEFDFIVSKINGKQDPELYSSALAASVFRDQNVYLSQLRQLLQIQSQSVQYFYLSLKEFVERKGQVEGLSVFLLQETKNKDKNLLRTVAEILAKLASEDRFTLELIYKGLSDPDSNIRFTCANSIRYEQTQSLDILINHIQAEKEIEILQALIKAITQSVYHGGLKCSAALLQALKASCLNRFEVRELDFGNFKEKRDDAKDLRSQAFHLLEIGLERGFDISETLREAITNFATDKFDETRIPRLRIIHKVCLNYPQNVEKQSDDLLPQLDNSLTELSKVLTREKQMKDKTQSTLEKDREKIKLLLTCLQAFAKAVPSHEGVQKLNSRIMADRSFEGCI